MRRIGKVLVSALSRRTSGRQLIPEIDGLRAVAILSVLLFHGALNYEFNTGLGERGGPVDAFVAGTILTGEYGVPLFFVISGFILALPFAQYHLYGERKPKLSKYLLRRVTRLEPPYLIALTVLFAFEALRSGGGSFFGEELPHYLASCFYVHQPIYGKPSTVLVITWSLEVEVQFYLLAPLITQVFRLRSAWARRAVLGAAIVVVSALFAHDRPIEGPTVLHQGGYFLAGLLLADLYLTRLRHVTSAHALGDVLAVVGIAGPFVLMGTHLRPALFAPWLILAGYAGVFIAGPVRRVFRWTPVVILGGMCYTIYLWHYQIIAFMRPVVFRVLDLHPVLWDRLAYVAIVSVPPLVASAVLFALIERPTMDPRWPQKLWAFARKLVGLGPGGENDAPEPPVVSVSKLDVGRSRRAELQDATEAPAATSGDSSPS